MFFHQNVPLKPYRRPSAWRKIALGTWSKSGDPSVYSLAEIDATAILKIIEDYKLKGIRLTPTAVVARGLALTFAKYPHVNGILRLGRKYQRKNIDIFLQVAHDDDQDNLSGLVIRDADQKSLEEMSTEMMKRSSVVKQNHQKEDFHHIKKILDWLPGFMMGPILKLIGLINYDLNLWFPIFKLPKDSFGSAMITSVGMLGIDNALTPLVPHSRCPLLICIGRISDRPFVINKEVVARSAVTLGITLDHRFIDGVMGAKMLQNLKEYLHQPY